jgi:hypothetical protein
VYRGLLPFNQTQGCDPATDARCTTTLLTWSSGTPPSASKIGGYGTIETQNCTWQSGGTVAECVGEYREDSGNPSGEGILLELTATINNVAMGLRRLDWTRAQVQARNMDPDPWQPVTLEPFPDTRAAMNAGGSVTIRLRGRLPNIDAMGWNTWAEFRVRLERAVISDHALLDASTSSPLGWFVRNQWYRDFYYAAAQMNTAVSLPSLGCSTNGSDPTDLRCLRFNDNGTHNIRALLVLAGRSLNNPAGRPTGTLSDYLEHQNCDFDGSLGDCNPRFLYEQRPTRRTTIASNPNSPMNDRVVLVDWSSSLNSSQATSESPLLLVTLP